MTPALQTWGASLARISGVERLTVYGAAGRRPEASDVLTVALDTEGKMGFASPRDMELVRTLQEKVRASHGALTLCLLFTDATVLLAGNPPCWQRDPAPSLRAAVRIGTPFSDWWPPSAASFSRPAPRP